MALANQLLLPRLYSALVRSWRKLRYIRIRPLRFYVYNQHGRVNPCGGSRSASKCVRRRRRRLRAASEGLVECVRRVGAMNVCVCVPVSRRRQLHRPTSTYAPVPWNYVVTGDVTAAQISRTTARHSSDILRSGGDLRIVSRLGTFPSLEHVTGLVGYYTTVGLRLM